MSTSKPSKPATNTEGKKTLAKPSSTPKSKEQVKKAPSSTSKGSPKKPSSLKTNKPSKNSLATTSGRKPSAQPVQKPKKTPRKDATNSSTGSSASIPVQKPKKDLTKPSKGSSGTVPAQKPKKKPRKDATNSSTGSSGSVPVKKPTNIKDRDENRNNRRPVERNSEVIPFKKQREQTYPPSDLDELRFGTRRRQPFYPERDILGVGQGEIEEKIIRHHYKNGIITTEALTVEKRSIMILPQLEPSRPTSPVEVHHHYYYNQSGSNQLTTLRDSQDQIGCQGSNAPPKLVQCCGGQQPVEQPCRLPQRGSPQRQIRCQRLSAPQQEERESCCGGRQQIQKPSSCCCPKRGNNNQEEVPIRAPPDRNRVAWWDRLSSPKKQNGKSRHHCCH